MNEPRSVARKTATAWRNALGSRQITSSSELIAHCLVPEAGGYTPSDFQKANLSREDFDDVMASLDLDEDI